MDTASLLTYLGSCDDFREEDAVNRFLQRHAGKVMGVLSGFDRLVLRGTLLGLSYVDGLRGFLGRKHVLLKDFVDFAQGMTERLKAAVVREAEERDRPVLYLPSSRTSKGEMAQEIAVRDGIEEGLVAVLRCIEPCMSYTIYRNRDARRLELRPRQRKCLHYYQYRIDPVFGFVGARIQTWFPFTIQITINGREWLARRMDETGLAYLRRDNSFAWIKDVERAQRMMDRQLRLSWPRHLRRIARQLNPAHGRMFRGSPQEYYWSASQSEWATDLMFYDAPTLASIYPALVDHAMGTFSSADVMRFLQGRVYQPFKGEIVSDFKNRPEGVRVKHRMDENSVKMYDKQGSTLRIETTVNEPKRFKVYRPKESDSDGEWAWQPMRKGVADLHRRAEVSQASNDRYLDALAGADTTQRLGAILEGVTRPRTWKKRRVRGLRPWMREDIDLLTAISQGEFAINGLRNRDLRALLYNDEANDPKERRKRSARISRLLRMLRAHRLIRKVPNAHRYIVTATGHAVSAAVRASQVATMNQLQAAA